MTNDIWKINKNVVFLRLNIAPNLSGCMSSWNYALILFKTFGFVAGIHMMMVCNSKSFKDLKCMSGSNFSFSFYLFLYTIFVVGSCGNHKKCWFSMVTTFISFTCIFAAIHKIFLKYTCIRNDEPSMHIRKPFLHIMNHANIYSIVWERHVD